MHGGPGGVVNVPASPPPNSNYQPAALPLSSVVGLLKLCAIYMPVGWLAGWFHNVEYAN